MAFAFFELSGGKDFTPRKAELMAEAKAAEEAARTTRVESVEPANEPPTVMPDLALRTAPTPVAREVRAEASVAEPVQSAVTDDTPTPTTFVSLEQGGDMFESTVIQLRPILDEMRSVSVQRPEPPADMREVMGRRVNIRRGPGTGYDIVTSLPQGTAVEVIEADGSGWVKLRTLDENQVGWMAEYLLSKPTG